MSVRTRQDGASLVEYTIGLIFFISVLLAPVFDGDNVIDLLADAIKKEHAAYMHATSLPL